MYGYFPCVVSVRNKERYQVVEEYVVTRGWPGKKKNLSAAGPMGVVLCYNDPSRSVLYNCVRVLWSDRQNQAREKIIGIKE